MNDSLRTDVFVRYPPETIAVACIYLSARKLKEPLPKNPSWFEVLGMLLLFFIKVHVKKKVMKSNELISQKYKFRFYSQILNGKYLANKSPRSDLI